jgi:hypothetical protein
LHEKFGRVSVSLENWLFQEMSLEMLEAKIWLFLSLIMREPKEFGWFEFVFLPLTIFLFYVRENKSRKSTK